MQGILKLIICATFFYQTICDDIPADTLVEFSNALKGFINAFGLQKYPQGTPIDIVLVVDSSGSVGPVDFNCSLQVLRDIIDIINAKNPISWNGTHVGVASYATNSNEDLTLRLGRSRDAIIQTIDKLVYNGGDLNTERGLGLAGRMLVRGGRPIPHRIILLLTDGRTSSDKKLDNTIAYIKKQGIEIFAIPIKTANMEMVRRVVSVPTNVHIVEALDYCTLLKGFYIVLSETLVSVNVP